jgi:hypothetical protein
MSYSLIFKDSLGKTKFDARYSAHVLDQSGIATLVANYYTESHQPFYEYVSLTARKVPPLVAFIPPSDQGVVFTGYTQTGGLFDGGLFEAGETVNVPWRSYAPFTSVASDDYGIRLTDEKGRITFDSRQTNILKIKEIFNVSIGNDVTDYTDVTHTTSNPYYLLAPTGYKCLITTISVYGCVALRKLSSTSVRLLWQPLYRFESGGVNFTENPGYKLLVIEP